MEELKKTISIMLGHGSLSHNRRNFYAAHVDRDRTADNICLCDRDIRTVYHELFGEAVARYNAKQTREERKITDYYKKIQTSKQERLFHEVIVQIGNCYDTFIGSSDGELAKEILLQYAHDFAERNPFLSVIQCVLHMDEASPHLHIDFVPFIHTDGKRGLDTRVSLKQALKAQGFVGSSKSESEGSRWVQAEKEYLATIMEQHGIVWEQKHTHRPHLSVLDYKVEERQRELKELELQEENLQSHIESMITVLNDDDVARVVEEASEWTEEVQQLIQEQNAVMNELEEMLEDPNQGWHTKIQDALFVWQHIFSALQDLLHKISNALMGLFLYGVFVKKPELSHEISGIAERLRGAQERAFQSDTRLNEMFQHNSRRHI